MYQYFPDKTITLKKGMVYALIKKVSNVIIGIYSSEEQAMADLSELGEHAYRVDIRIIDEPIYH